MYFQRIRDRPAPIQPVSEPYAPEPGALIKKRVAPDPQDQLLDWDGDETPNAGDVPMHPFHTTVKRVEHREMSSEKKLRLEHSPCIEEMLKMRVHFLKEKEREERREIEKEKRRQEQREQMQKLEEAIESGNLDDLDLDLGEEPDGDVPVPLDEDDADTEEFKRVALFMKEKKIVTQRQSALLHRPLSDWRIFRISWKVWYNNGRSFVPCAAVLPWMYVGRGSLAKDIHFLQNMGFTHIMNCSKEIPNFHSSKFIYQRIPIDDKNSENAAARFNKAIEFIKRVSHAKGKIYIHCTVGVSRAPVMAMAFFIAIRKIALLDIYKYFQAVRTVIQPNKHFLYQLAELELKEGLGSSVLYHKDWRHYEYNNIRGDVEVYRRTEGVYSTAKRIHSAENAKLDYVDDYEAELARRAMCEQNYTKRIHYTT